MIKEKEIYENKMTMINCSMILNWIEIVELWKRKCVGFYLELPWYFLFTNFIVHTWIKKNKEKSTEMNDDLWNLDNEHVIAISVELFPWTLKAFE
jgi:hypothetical protein